MLLKVIACEIAARELYHAAALSPNLIDLELVTQGYHDTPTKGRQELQKHIDLVPAGKYDRILLGYGLCSSILAGITTAHTPLVIPRAHDCITFFLGSKERYQKCFAERPGTYYYTSGWLECAQRRGITGTLLASGTLPADSNLGMKGSYEEWVQKYGEEQANYLMEEMARWTDSYTHGTLIDFDFTKPLSLDVHVQKICKERNWTFDQIDGDLALIRGLLNGPWPESAFLTVVPGQKVVPSFGEDIIRIEPYAG